MLISTEVFGEIQIDKETIIKFKEGLLGFEEEKEFAIIDTEDKDSPFSWLQSINTPELAFVIINPFYAFPDYEFIVPKKIQEKLEIQDEKDIAIYSIVVIPEDMEKMTANLLGPIIININKKLGKQLILDDNRYSTKHFIFQTKVESGDI
jgi:flagellar assembly factor FliW